MASLWLGISTAGRAQFSLGNSLPPSVPPVAGALVEQPWPAVEWGMQPKTVDMDGQGQPLGTQPASGVTLDAAGGNIVITAPDDEAETKARKESKPETGPLRLGNVSFNQAAASFNVGKPDDWKAGDLSRQFGGAAIMAKNVAPSTPLGVWAIGGLVVVALIVALTIGFYESDRDDRKRRKKNRRHRHSS